MDCLTEIPWTLARIKKSRRNGPTVLSTFSGGGGSSMGYQLAGFRSIGAVELDPRMAKLYAANVSCKVWIESVADFTERCREGLPFDGELDVLDGSPPCSVFSMSGDRDAKWGIKAKFREGQAVQRLDNLFLDFVELASVLRPRVVIGENVRGMIFAKAKGYMLETLQAFRDVGYDPQLFVLNASRMGVPQTRERLFIVARRRDLGLEPIDLQFDEPIITAEKALADLSEPKAPRMLPKKFRRMWLEVRPGDLLSKGWPKNSYKRAKNYYFNLRRASPIKPFHTVSATFAPFHWSVPRYLTDLEIGRAQSFPDDYNYGKVGAAYVCGMSVPPLMMQRLAGRISEWIA